MGDPLKRVEARLSRLEPSAFSSDLSQRIEARLAAELKRPLADHFLLAAMCSGAIAACVIVGVLVAEPSAPPRALPESLAADHAIRFGDSPQVLARSDAGWGDGMR